jgi:mitotic spindle assembly checkpoint protein MAD2B
MDPQRQPLFLNTFASLIEAFTDFLVVSIHTILRSRVLYPPNIFITTRKYNLPVAQLRHPKVCTWILNACSAIRTQLLEGVVDRIFVVIYTQDAKVVERWVFDIGGFPVVPRDEALTEFEYLGGGKGASIVDVEEQLRAIVGKLAYHGERMEQLPENCTFTVAVELKKMADPPPDVCC